MDDDPVLRSLSDDLERSDPELAAMLSGQAPHPRRHSIAWILLGLPLLVPALLSGRTRPPHRHSAAWLLLALPLLLPALILPLRVTLGLHAMALILASPGMVCWLCAVTEGPATRRP